MANLLSQINIVTAPKAVQSQVKIAAQSMKSKIANALVGILEGMNRFNYVAFDKVRLNHSDFKDWEIPAAQFIDIAETVEHERSRVKRSWQIQLEVTLRSSSDEYVNQQDLWNIEYQIARAIWKNPQLGVPGVIQATYISNATDLHNIKPYYILYLVFEVSYYEHLVADC